MSVNKKILVVEDDADIRECLQEALEMIGYPSHACCNGREALELLENIEAPSLILLDLMMPVMNGHEFCEVKKTNPKIADIPVVVVSADGNLSQKAKKLGVDGAITKPVDFAILIQITRKYCGPVSA